MQTEPERTGDYVVWCLVRAYVGGWGVVCGVVVSMRGRVVVFVVSVVVFLWVREAGGAGVV